MKQFKFTESWLDLAQFKREFQKIEVQEYPNNLHLHSPKPTVSVVLVTYQHVNFVEAAIKCVLNQKTNVSYELIIGDDQSTDGTREICIDYATRYPDKIRLQLHTRENNISVLGTPCGIFQIAYNILISRGNYLALLSGDDEWTSDVKLQRQFDFLEENPAVAMTYLPFRERRRTESGVTVGQLCRSFPMPSSVMYRNVFQRLPREFLSVLNEDNFLNAISDLHGRCVETPCAGEIVINLRDSNIWAARDNEFKARQRFNTERILYKVLGPYQSLRTRIYANQIYQFMEHLERNELAFELQKSLKLWCFFTLYRMKGFFRRTT